MTTAYSGQGISIGHLLAEVDMNSHQWKFVTTASGTGGVGKFKLSIGGSLPVPLGVLQDDVRAGEPGQIKVLGTTKVAASGAIGYGDYVVCGSNGFAWLTTSVSNPAQGIALTALASGSGYIEVLLIPNGYAFGDNTL